VTDAPGSGPADHAGPDHADNADNADHAGADHAGHADDAGSGSGGPAGPAGDPPWRRHRDGGMHARGSRQRHRGPGLGPGPGPGFGFGGEGRRRAPPHWWPQGEPWPPTGPPWHRAPRRFRRRFVLAALGVLGLLVGTGIVLGLIFSPRGERSGGGRFERDGRPPGVVVVGGVVLVGTAATALAYHRISRPVGDLLGAAERVAAGDYDVRLLPAGPRELQMLTTTFNDMATRLADTEAQRRRFLADITHELRTPLAVLQSGIEAQIDGIHARDETHLASLLEEAQRLGRLIDDLHTLALADAGRIVLHRERLHPAALVDDAVASHRALAERTGVRLVTDAAPSGALPEVEVDPMRIHQVLDNLLSNAVRHTPAGQEVRVTLEPAARIGDGDDRQGVRITVADTGPGFPPDGVDQVFERFTRAADSRGSGLGLSIARDLVEAHGGTIRAWNVAAGGGAGVAFTVPAAPVP
jgi:signal transduction histidine kinase